MQSVSYAPVRVPLSFTAGDDVPIPLRFKSAVTVGGPTTPMDLTGASLQGRIKGPLSTQVTSLGVNITSAVNGEATAQLTSVQSAAINPTSRAVTAVWEIQLTDSLGSIRTLICGPVTIYPQVLP